MGIIIALRKLLWARFTGNLFFSSLLGAEAVNPAPVLSLMPHPCTFYLSHLFFETNRLFFVPAPWAESFE